MAAPLIPSNPQLENYLRNQPLPAFAELAPSPDPYDDLGILDYVRILRRRKWTLVCICVLCAAVAVGIGLLEHPAYRATADIEILDEGESSFNLKQAAAGDGGMYGMSEAYVQTQAEILQEGTLIADVVDKLKLTDKPEFTRTPTLSELKHRFWSHTPAPERLRDRAIAVAASKLSVNSSPHSRIIRISFESGDPALAAAFLNTLVDEFIEHSLESRWEAAKRTENWLANQLNGVRSKLETSEKQLQLYANGAGLIYTGDKSSVDEEKLRQLQAELSSAHAERVQKETLYGTLVAGGGQGVPENLKDATVRDYQVRLTDLRRQLADLSSILTPSNYKVQRVQAQIGELEAALENERKNTITGIQNEYRAAKSREDMLAEDYSKQAGLVAQQANQAIRYTMLKREVDTARSLYEAMLQRAEEASVGSTLKASDIHVIGPAKPPGDPIKPNLELNSIVGIFGGVLAGIPFILLREHAQRRVQAPSEIAALLNLPEIVTIPSARLYPVKPRWSVLARQHDPVALVTWKHKRSLLAESFRELAAAFFTSHHRPSRQVVLISSACPREGKTAVISNLAIAITEMQQKVLLIDADLRKPSLDTVFDVPGSTGLSTVLQSKRSPESMLSEVIVSTGVPGLSILPAGSPIQGDSAADLLHSKNWIAMMRELRKEFDYILIDGPPAMHLADARILARHCDGVLLVVRANQTSRDLMRLTAQRFAIDGIRLLGTVLNDWDPRSSASALRYYARNGDYFRS